jgi:hypothetical protein
MPLIDTMLPNQRYKIFISPLNKGGWGGHKYDILHRAIRNRGYTNKTHLRGFETCEELQIDPPQPPLKRGEQKMYLFQGNNETVLVRVGGLRLYSPRF